MSRNNITTKRGDKSPFFVLYSDIRHYNKRLILTTEPDNGGYYRKYWVIHDTEQIVFTVNLLP